MSQIIFPGEREIGGMLTFQMPNNSILHPLKIEGGLFNGTGNAANDFRASASFVIYQGLPQISLGYGFHRTNYKNPLVDGQQPSYSYSAPQNLVAHQTMLTAYYESEHFYLNVDIEYGREASEKNNDKVKNQFRYNVATIGFKATRKLSFELNRESSNSTIANAEDTYNESTMGARISYLF